jgi:hypothetical protein
MTTQSKGDKSMNATRSGAAMSVAAALVMGPGGEARSQEGYFELEGPVVNSCVNSTAWEWGVNLSRDGSELFFGSDRAGGMDLYAATWDEGAGAFTSCRGLSDVNTGNDWEAGGSLSSDGTTLYYESSQFGGGALVTDLFEATWNPERSEFEDPSVIVGLSSIPGRIYRPSVSADDYELYFNHDSDGNANDMDLWVAWRSSLNEQFTSDRARPLDEVNSRYNEFGPVILGDGKTLFWTGFKTNSHDGNAGFSTSTIWMASREEKFDPKVHSEPPRFGNIRKHVMVPGIPAFNVAVPDSWPQDGARIFFVSCAPGSCSEFFSVYDVYSAVWQAAPTPRVQLVAEPSTGTAPLTVCASAEAVTPLDTTVDSLTFDFGDGSPQMDGAQGQTCHVYDRPGVFTATAQATAQLPSGETWTAAASQPITAQCPSGDVAPWTATDIGAVRLPGGARIAGEYLETCAAGRGMVTNKDSFHFVHQEIEDGVITARIASFTGKASARAGLVVRESLAEDAAFAAALLSLDPAAGAQMRLLHRASAGDGLRPAVNGPALAAPEAWLRLERRGDAVRGSWSLDGTSWTLISELSLALPPRIYAGVATAGADGGTNPFIAARATVWGLTLERGAPAPRFRRGDTDSSGSLQLTDAVALLNFLFTGGPRPACLDAGDFDDSGRADISDAIANLGYQFLGGPAPAAPGPSDCGPDSVTETPDLGCEKGC